MLIVGQISKSGTVLKSWECADFKTVPDFGIWPRFDGENLEINTDDFFLGHGVCSGLPDLNIHRVQKNWPFCFSSISRSNLGQISKSGTVLKSAHSQLSKTVPDFEIYKLRKLR